MPRYIRRYSPEEIEAFREDFEYWQEEQKAKLKHVISLICRKLTPQMIDEIVATAPKSARRIASYLCRSSSELARWATANDAERKRLIVRSVLAKRPTR